VSIPPVRLNALGLEKELAWDGKVVTMWCVGMPSLCDRRTMAFSGSTISNPEDIGQQGCMANLL